MKALDVAWKDIQILLKDRGSLALSFVVPFVFILAFSLPRLSAGSSKELLPLPVVNLDGSAASEDLISRLGSVGGVQVQTYEADEAAALLAEGDVSWVLEVPADFGAMSLEHPVSLSLTTHPAADQVDADSVAMIVKGVADEMALEAQLLASFRQLGEMMAGQPGAVQLFSSEVPANQARRQFESSKTIPLVSVEQTTPSVSGEQPQSYGSNVFVPGIAVLFVFLSSQVMAQSVFQERRLGSFRRLLAAPVSKGALLLGKVLPNLALTLLQLVVVFGVSALVLPALGLEPLTFRGSAVALVLVSLSVAVCSAALGLLLSALAHSEAQAGALSAVVLWVLAAVGGSFFPTFLMQGPIRALSSVAPHSWALRAYNDLLVYGGGLREVLPELGVLLAFSVAFFVIGLWRFDFD